MRAVFEHYRIALASARAALLAALPHLGDLDGGQIDGLLSQIGSDLMAKLGNSFVVTFKHSKLEPKNFQLMRQMRVQIKSSIMTVTLFECLFTMTEPRWQLERMIIIVALLGLAAPRQEQASLDIVFSLSDITENDQAGFSGAGDNCFLTPDPPFAQTCGYSGFRTKIKNNMIPFEERRSSVFWRGKTSGGPTAAGAEIGPRPFFWLQRLDVCYQLATGRNAAHCDVGITDSDNITDAKHLRAIDEAGLRKPRVEKMEFMNFKLALDIDGQSNAWSGLFLNLLMGCCTVKVGSPRQFRQWYYGKMRAWEHYVPVASDLSDLNDVVSRCLDGRIDIETIGRGGREFAEGLTFESEIEDLAARLEALMRGDNDRKRRYAELARRHFG